MRFHDAKVGKQRVDMDSQHLIRMIELVRQGLGYSEDVGTALLRLQHSCSRFADCLAEKYSNGEGQ